MESQLYRYVRYFLNDLPYQLYLQKACVILHSGQPDLVFIPNLYKFSNIQSHNIKLICNLGHENIVNLLIVNGANVNIVNKGRKSALHMAAFNGKSLFDLM